MAPDPVTGEPVAQKLTIWQKSRPWERVFMLVAAIVPLAAFNYWWNVLN
jgi:hypothetical protein